MGKDDTHLSAIVNLGSAIMTRMEAKLPSINSEIDTIINEKSTSTQIIESMLDTLLDYGNMGIGETEFKRLNSYYASFNKENAECYDDYYRELDDE